MPTASTAKKKTTPRKRRTRKTTTTPLNKSVTKQVVTEVRGTKVSSKSVTQSSPAPVRPAKPNLSWEDYRADAIVTAIHDNIRYHEACTRASKRLLMLVKRTNRRQSDNESNVIQLKTQ